MTPQKLPIESNDNESEIMTLPWIKSLSLPLSVFGKNDIGTMYKNPFLSFDYRTRFFLIPSMGSV